MYKMLTSLTRNGQIMGWRVFVVNSKSSCFATKLVVGYQADIQDSGILMHTYAGYDTNATVEQYALHAACNFMPSWVYRG